MAFLDGLIPKGNTDSLTATEWNYLINSLKNMNLSDLANVDSGSAINGETIIQNDGVWTPSLAPSSGGSGVWDQIQGKPFESVGNGLDVVANVLGISSDNLGLLSTVEDNADNWDSAYSKVEDNADNWDEAYERRSRIDDSSNPDGTYLFASSAAAYYPSSERYIGYYHPTTNLKYKLKAYRADSADTADYASDAKTSLRLTATDNRDMKPSDYTDDADGKAVRALFWGSNSSSNEDGRIIGASTYGDLLYLNTYSDSSGGGVNGLVFGKQSNKAIFRMKGDFEGDWTSKFLIPQIELPTSDLNADLVENGVYTMDKSEGILTYSGVIAKSNMVYATHYRNIDSAAQVRLSTSYGNTLIGMLNEDYTHMSTEGTHGWYFDKGITTGSSYRTLQGGVFHNVASVNDTSYDTGSASRIYNISGLKLTYNGLDVYHAGNSNSNAVDWAANVLNALEGDFGVIPSSSIKPTYSTLTVGGSKVASSEAVLSIMSTEQGTAGSGLALCEYNESDQTFTDMWSFSRETTDGSGNGKLKLRFGQDKTHFNNLEIVAFDHNSTADAVKIRGNRVYHAGNSNNSAVDWSANRLTAIAATVGQITIQNNNEISNASNSVFLQYGTGNGVQIGSASVLSKLDVYGDASIKSGNLTVEGSMHVDGGIYASAYETERTKTTNGDLFVSDSMVCGDFLDWDGNWRIYIDESLTNAVPFSVGDIVECKVQDNIGNIRFWKGEIGWVDEDSTYFDVYPYKQDSSSNTTPQKGDLVVRTSGTTISLKTSDDGNPEIVLTDDDSELVVINNKAGQEIDSSTNEDTDVAGIKLGDTVRFSEGGLIIPFGNGWVRSGDSKSEGGRGLYSRIDVAVNNLRIDGESTDRDTSGISAYSAGYANSDRYDQLTAQSYAFHGKGFNHMSSINFGVQETIDGISYSGMNDSNYNGVYTVYAGKTISLPPASYFPMGHMIMISMKSSGNPSVVRMANYDKIGGASPSTYFNIEFASNMSSVTLVKIEDDRWMLVSSVSINIINK